MENAKQRILSWETRHGIRATGLRRRFNHALLLEAAGKRKRQPETIDLTGDSDDDIAPTPSRTIGSTSPSTTKRKTKKEGFAEKKDKHFGGQYESYEPLNLSARAGKAH